MDSKVTTGSAHAGQTTNMPAAMIIEFLSVFILSYSAQRLSAGTRYWERRVATGLRVVIKSVISTRQR